MTTKLAFITGITGQDGSYLAELLIEKGYKIFGIVRRTSLLYSHTRIDHIRDKLNLEYGDLTDGSSLTNYFSKIVNEHPNFEIFEVYNLGAQSHVKISFEIPEYTSEVSGLGTLRMLEAMRFLNLKKTKFYQASTSELFGEKPNKINSFDENSLMVPKSPYGVSKLYSYYITKVYREAYGFYACNGILFNHESPRRGETFVTRKITMFFAKKILGSKEILYLGNLDAKRDWGHAKDYTEMQWKILQQKRPEDFVIATGKTTSVRDFINECCKYLNLKILWTGKGLNEKAYLVKGKRKELIIKIDKKYFRPLEIDYLKGDPKKAFKKLNYKLKHNLKDLVKDMLLSDINKLKKKI